jgi:hypothetical protein
LVVALGAGGRERGGAVEAGEACLAGEAAGVADFDGQPGLDPLGDAAHVPQARAGLLCECLERHGRLAVLGVEVGNGVAVAVEKLEPQRGGGVPRVVIALGQGSESGPDVGGVRQRR